MSDWVATVRHQSNTINVLKCVGGSNEFWSSLIQVLTFDDWCICSLMHIMYIPSPQWVKKQRQNKTDMLKLLWPSHEKKCVANSPHCLVRYQEEFLGNMMMSSIGNIFALLALCARNSPVTDEFHSHRPVMWSLMFSLINTWISGWVNSHEACDFRLWRHCNDSLCTSHTI